MGRVAPLAGALVAAACGAAWADSTHRIRVETTPPGAHVYLGDKSSGPKCEATPCEFDAPLGDDILIVELEDHDPVLDTIEVKRSRDKKPQVFHYDLKGSVATIVVDDPRAKGASIQIDGKEKAKAPAHVEVDAGGHQVIVKLGGKTLFEDFVEVNSGEEKQIQVAAGGGGGDGDGDGSGSDGDGDGDGSDGGDGSAGHADGSGSAHDGGGDGGAIHKPAPVPAARERFLLAQLVMDVGWRRFHYEHPVNGLAPNEGEDGQVIGGPAIELWPAELLHSTHLRGLSLFLRAEFKVNSLDVKDGMTGATLATTSWNSFEASLRQRWQTDAFGVEVSGGYVRDMIQYDGDEASLMMLPSADYQSIRIGARAYLRSGHLEPYLAAETRLVLAGGSLQDNFRNASATGLRGAAGVEATFGAIFTRVEGSYLQYSWTYPTDVTPPQPATGASDKIFGFSISAGYQY